MTKGKRFKATAILYGILAVICLVGIKHLFFLFIICACLCIINGYLAYRHKDEQPSPIIQKVMRKIGESKQRKKDEKSNKKQLKQEYKERLKQIDEEFELDYGDDDTNAEIDDEEDF